MFLAHKRTSHVLGGVRTPLITFSEILATIIQIDPLFCPMSNDCIEVDELILKIADYKNDYARLAAEKLMRTCSTSWEAYQYMQDRVHDVWLPDGVQRQVQRIIQQIRVQIHQQREYS